MLLSTDTVKAPFKWSKLFINLVLLVGGLISFFPFYWLVGMASNKTNDIFQFPSKLIFGSQLLTTVSHVLAHIASFGAFLNSLFVSGIHHLSILFFCSLPA